MSFKFKNYNFTNLPRPLTREDYENSLNLVISSLTKQSNVRSIYLLGSEWMPGISDMDIIVVYKDITDFKPYPSPWSLDEKTKFIFTHRYFSYSGDVFFHYYYIFPEETSNLRCVWGENISVQRPDDIIKADIIFSFLFDIYINKLLLIPYLIRPNLNISVRRVIGELYSLKYTFLLLEKYCNLKDKRYQNFINSISKLRAEWFENNPDRNLTQLIELHQTAIDMIYDSFLQFGSCVKTKFIDTDISNFHNLSQIVFLTKKLTVNFTDEVNSDLFVNSLCNKSIRFKFRKYKIENYYLLIPDLFLVFFLWYSYSKTDWGRTFRSALKKSDKMYLNQVPEGIEMRLQVLSRLIKDSTAVQGYFKIPFDFGLIFNKSVKNSILISLLKLIRYVK